MNERVPHPPAASSHNGIYLEQRGAGPPLVMLHGWGLNLRVFDILASTLAADFRVFAVDLPGHGRSTATRLADLEPLLDVLPSRFALLGWSLGGQIALRLAAQTPARIAALILISTTPRFTRAADWSAGLPAAVLDGFAKHLQRDYRRTISDFLEWQVRGAMAADATLAALRATLLNHGEASGAALRAGLELLRVSDLRSVLPSISAPSLLIAGQYDRVTPAAAAQSMLESMPDARLLEIRRAGHAPFLSHAADCAAAIRALLEQPQAASCDA